MTTTPTIDFVIDNDESSLGQNYAGNVAPGTNTNDHTLTLRGTADAGALLQIYNGSELLPTGPLVVGENGQWEFTFEPGLPGTAFDPNTGEVTIGFYQFRATATLNGVTTALDDFKAATVDTEGNPVELASYDVNIQENAVCFLKGTRIQTPAGEVAVEHLKIGDLVSTSSGQQQAIKWIGRRSYVTRFLASHGRRNVLPVRIARGALDEGVPHRDLYVSPEHAVCLQGALIPARNLVNGRSIAYAESMETIEYYHIELPTHAVLIAEGAATESWLDCGNRNFFMNVVDYLSLGLPDQAPGKPCLPFVKAGPLLDEVRARLLARTAAVGYDTTSDADVHLIVDGQRANAATTTDNQLYRFELPSVPATLVIGSRSVTPADMDPEAKDGRQLGVSLMRVVLRCAGTEIQIGHEHPLLTEGFHGAEPGHRWTNGMAVIPTQFLACLAGAVQVEIHVAGCAAKYPKGFEAAAVVKETGRHLRLAA
jgi:hypothetical protein